MSRISSTVTKEPISVVRLSRLSATYWEWGKLGHQPTIPRGMDRSSDSIEQCRPSWPKQLRIIREIGTCVFRRLFSPTVPRCTKQLVSHLSIWSSEELLSCLLMLGRMEEADFQDYPPFVQGLHSKLKCAFEQTRGKLSTSHKHQKRFYDRGSRGSELKVGDRVWLYVYILIVAGSIHSS